MNIYNFFFVLFLLNRKNLTQGHDPSCDEKNVKLLTILTSVFGSTTLLFLLIIIYLAILLKRNTLNQYGYNIFASSIKQGQATNDNPVSGRTFVTQTSQEMTILKMNDSNGLENSFKGNESSCPINMSQSFTINDASLPKSNSLIKNSGVTPNYRDIKSVQPNSVASQKIMLRDQMKTICDAAIAKLKKSGITVSLKDLHDLLQSDDNCTPETLEQAARVKSTSYPDLDIYDNNPSNIPIEENTYDCPPSASNKHVILKDFDTDYMLTISKEPIEEPTYINYRDIHSNNYL